VVYDEALLLALEQVGWTEFRQTVWRRVFMGRPPLAENVDGARWNPPGVSALYTSLTEATAIHEHEHLIDMQGKPPKLAPTMYQVEVNVKRCLRVESEALTALGVDFSNPDSSACRAACERIGGAAAHVGAEALLVPSVREPDQWNLVLFTANVDLTAGSYYDLVSLGE